MPYLAGALEGGLANQAGADLMNAPAVAVKSLRAESVGFIMAAPRNRLPVGRRATIEALSRGLLTDPTVLFP